MAMGLFFQDLRPSDAFFDRDHFKFLCVATYNKLINDEFDQAKLRNKMMEGFSYVEVSPDWLLKEVIKVETDDKKKVKYAIPKSKIFSFGFDNMSSGIQMVAPIGECPCGDLIRISYKDKWQYCRAPITSDTYFYQAIDRVEFLGLTSCIPDEVEMWYISQPASDDDNSEIADKQVMPIITTVLNVMFGAKNGEVIDMTNDANSNAQPATEANADQVINKQQ